MHLVYAVIFRRFCQRAPFRLRRLDLQPSACIRCKNSLNSYSTISGEGDDDNSEKRESAAKDSKEERSEAATSDGTVGTSRKLNLAKPGGSGKAGILRTLRERGELDETKGRRKAAAMTSKNDDGSTSDDELMSSSSSSSSDDEEKPKEKPSELLKPDIRKAVKDVSESLGGDKKQIRSELLKKLMEHEKENYNASKIREHDDEEKDEAGKETGKEANLSSDKLGALLSAMAVKKETEAKSGPESRQRIARNMVRTGIQPRDRRRQDERPGRKQQETGEIQYERTDFFDSGPGLGIFTPAKNKLKPSWPPLLPVWENLEHRRLKQLTTREPRDGFEELIRWTEEGKVHPFPMDNDYGHYEQNVPFHEHVFLDHLLDDGFPSNGPIRHFMELIVHGLSSNPYMSVEKKHDHVAWFRDYFQKRGAEIEKLHELDLKHQQALAALEAGTGETMETATTEPK